MALSLNTNVSSSLAQTLAKLTASAQTTVDQVAAGQKKDAAASDSALISAEAIAAAEKADNAKTLDTLSAAIRQLLDAQYAAAKASKSDAKSDFSEMSGRALAVVALNRTGAFSRTEMATAKRELRDRTLAELNTSLKSGNALSALADYNEKLVAAYDAMSQEERDARGWTADVREKAEAFVAAVKGTDTMPSLFAMLEGEDSGAATSLF